MSLLSALPERSLLILDRLYGHAPMLRDLQEHCGQRDSHFLVRVRHKLAVKVQLEFRDGSAEVSVSLRDKERPRQQIAALIVREVRGQVWSRTRPKHGWRRCACGRA